MRPDAYPESNHESVSDEVGRIDPTLARLHRESRRAGGASPSPERLQSLVTGALARVAVIEGTRLTPKLAAGAPVEDTVGLSPKPAVGVLAGNTVQLTPKLAGAPGGDTVGLSPKLAGAPVDDTVGLSPKPAVGVLAGNTVQLTPKPLPVPRGRRLLSAVWVRRRSSWASVAAAAILLLVAGLWWPGDSAPHSAGLVDAKIPAAVAPAPNPGSDDSETIAGREAGEFPRASSTPSSTREVDLTPRARRVQSGASVSTAPTSPASSAVLAEADLDLNSATDNHLDPGSATDLDLGFAASPTAVDESATGAPVLAKAGAAEVVDPSRSTLDDPSEVDFLVALFASAETGVVEETTADTLAIGPATAQEWDVLSERALYDWALGEASAAALYADLEQ